MPQDGGQFGDPGIAKIRFFQETPGSSLLISPPAHFCFRKQLPRSRAAAGHKTTITGSQRFAADWSRWLTDTGTGSGSGTGQAAAACFAAQENPKSGNQQQDKSDQAPEERPRH